LLVEFNEPPDEGGDDVKQQEPISPGGDLQFILLVE
jgi:hypothetical protein